MASSLAAASRRSPDPCHCWLSGSTAGVTGGIFVTAALLSTTTYINPNLYICLFDFPIEIIRRIFASLYPRFQVLSGIAG
jgi:hypothetical protein